MWGYNFAAAVAASFPFTFAPASADQLDVRSLAACRTRVCGLIAENDFGALRGSAGHWAIVVERGSGPDMGALAGGNLSSGGPLRLHQAGTQANIRLMFQAMVTRLHSPRARPRGPRSKKN